MIWKLINSCLENIFKNNFSTYNIQDACDVVNGDEDMTTIVFNLICAADQSPYYSFPNNNNNYGQQLNQVSSEIMTIDSQAQTLISFCLPGQGWSQWKLEGHFIHYIFNFGLPGGKAIIINIDWHTSYL